MERYLRKLEIRVEYLSLPGANQPNQPILGAIFIVPPLCSDTYFGVLTSEYETDSFGRIQSSPSPLAGDPDPVQSGLVDQKPIQSNPIRFVRTVQICVH